jgi:hypothetical protein
MIRSTLCALLLATCLLAGSGSLVSASASGPIQGTLGQPMQVGPWQVMVESVARSHWAGKSALAVKVSLRNTDGAMQPMDSDQLFICYRADVWQALNFLGAAPWPAPWVAPGKTTHGRLFYELPPGVQSFGLVFFWQANGASATGIWLLTLD